MELATATDKRSADVINVANGDTIMTLITKDVNESRKHLANGVSYSGSMAGLGPGDGSSILSTPTQNVTIYLMFVTF